MICNSGIKLTIGIVDWSDTETDGTNGKIKHLWEESWDDDDTSDDFAAQLRYVSPP